MKRLLLTLVACGAVLLPMAAHAQRGMGFHGSSAPAARGPAARSAGFAGRPMGRVAPAGIRSAPTARFTSSQGRRGVIRGQRSFASNGRFFRNRRFRHNRFFFGNCFNTFGFNSFGCGNPFLFGDPFLFGGIGYPGDPFYYNNAAYPAQPEQQPVVEQDNGNRELALQMQELSEEVQAMREEQRSQGEPKRTESQPASQAPKDNSPNAILVFRDGVQLPVRNYAISGGTIFVMDKPNQKIDLSKLDVPATQQINDRNGLEIHLPKGN